MAATTNFRITTTTVRLFLAPQFGKKTITMLAVAYLVMVTGILFLTARPLQSESALDLGVSPQPVSYSPYVVVEIPGVHIPTAPYIFIDSATSRIIIALENPEVMLKASELSHQATPNGIEGANDSLDPLQTGLQGSH